MSWTQGESPAKELVRAARELAGLTQAEAAAVVYVSRRAWQDWESGARRMPPGLWEVFLLRSRAADEAEPLLWRAAAEVMRSVAEGAEREFWTGFLLGLEVSGAGVRWSEDGLSVLADERADAKAAAWRSGYLAGLAGEWPGR